MEPPRIRLKEEGGGLGCGGEGCPLWDCRKVINQGATPSVIHHNYHRGSLTASGIMGAVAGPHGPLEDWARPG